jgi:hypothetical protein
MVPIAALVTISRVALLLVAAAIATAIIGMLHVSSGWKASIDSVDLWAPWSDVDTSSEGGCVVMMLLLLGGSFGASQLVLQTNRLKATGRSAAVRAPRARAHGSKRISVRLLDGSLRFMEWLQDDFVLRKRARAAHRLALWPVIAAARAADRAAGLAMFLGSTMRGWAEGLMKWRRREYNRHWQTLTLGTKLFYLCVALVINAVPAPESSTTITSQLTHSNSSNTNSSLLAPRGSTPPSPVRCRLFNSPFSPSLTSTTMKVRPPHIQCPPCPPDVPCNCLTCGANAV